MKEFNVNEYITLKLEDGKTNIYIKGEKFIQCIRLFLHIPEQNIESFEEINSIDEATEVYDKYIYQNKIIQWNNFIPLRNQEYSISSEHEFPFRCNYL